MVISPARLTFTLSTLSILIRNILAPVFFIYALLLFVLTMLPVALVFYVGRTLLKEEAANRLIQKGFQVWMGLYMPLIFCPVQYRGRHYFKKGSNYVVTMNHNSFADVPVSSPGIPGPNRTLAKIELARVPVFGYIYRCGSILVSRQDAKSRKDSIPLMIDALNKGLHLCLFPEGTRNRGKESLASFYDGAFSIAIQTGKPIIPAVIFGTKHILHTDKTVWAWPHRIRMHFLPEIPTTGLSNADVATLKLQVFEAMKHYYESHPEWV